MLKPPRQKNEQTGRLVDITELDELLGPPPLLPNESRADYEGLKARLKAKIAPRDVLEEIWLRDILDLQWEVLRMRRLKALLLNNNSPAGLDSLLYRRVTHQAKQTLVEAWGRGDKAAIQEIAGILHQRGLSMDDIDSHTLLKTLEPLERIDRMVTQAEGRRNNALREIERSRESAARRLQKALSEEDGRLISNEALEQSS
jgi:hypothetical protein